MKTTYFLILIVMIAYEAGAQTWSPVGDGVYMEKNPKEPELDLRDRGSIKKVFNGRIDALREFKGELYAAGLFRFADGKTVNNIARWNGAKWTDVAGGVEGQIETLCIYHDALYAGGTFSSAGGIKANNIARWDGMKWSALSGEPDSHVSRLIVYRDELYAAGLFTTAGGKPANHIARWNGTKWSALGKGRDNDIYAITEYKGELYFGGTFLDAGDEKEKSIYKWNGHSWSDAPVHMDGAVSSMMPYQGNLCIGGYFMDINGTNIGFLAVGDGESNWSPLGKGIVIPLQKNEDTFSGEEKSQLNRAVVMTMLIHDGQLYAGGYLTAVGGRGVVRWDGSQWSNLGKGVSGGVHTMASYKGALYAAGDFTNAGGTKVNGIAKWGG